MWRSQDWLAPFGQAQVLAVTRRPPVRRRGPTGCSTGPACWSSCSTPAAGGSTSSPRCSTRSPRRCADPRPRGASGPTDRRCARHRRPESGAWWIAAVAHFMSATDEPPLPLVDAGVAARTSPRCSRRVCTSRSSRPSTSRAVPAGHVVVREDEELPRAAGPTRTARRPVDDRGHAVVGDRPGGAAGPPHRGEGAGPAGLRGGGRRRPLSNPAGRWHGRRADPRARRGHGDAARSSARCPGRAAGLHPRSPGSVTSCRRHPRPGLDRQAYSQAEAVADGADGGPAWTHYLERAIDDDGWLQRPAGCPCRHRTPPTSCGTAGVPGMCGTGSSKWWTRPSRRGRRCWRSGWPNHSPMRPARDQRRRAPAADRPGRGRPLRRTGSSGRRRRARAPGRGGSARRGDPGRGRPAGARPGRRPGSTTTRRPGEPIGDALALPGAPSPPGVEEIFGAGRRPTASCASWRHRSRASCRIRPRSPCWRSRTRSRTCRPLLSRPGERAGPRERWNG